ncbi:MAG TPA: hypothetical protein VIN61_02450 [Gammaproteobacteria bacterium]
MKRPALPRAGTVRRIAAALTLLLPAAAGHADDRWETEVIRVPRGEWTGPRLPDGQPDVQGFWSNTIGNHDNFTDPQGGIPGDVARAGGGGARDIGTVQPREKRAPSRVSDPPDGQVPFQPWARAKQEELLANFFHPTKEEHIEPLARCAPAGPTKSLMWHGYEIRQYPGYVLFLFDSGTRIIHLDGKPHLPASIKLWNADSRGRWEGNTLIVDVRNNNAKARLGRTGEFTSDNVHIEERYIFANDGQRYTYEAVYTDPTVLTRPFTVTIPAKRITVDSPRDGWHNQTFLANHPRPEPILETYERVCVEHNAGHGELAVAGGPP